MTNYVTKHILFNELYNYKLWFKKNNGKCFVTAAGFFLHKIESKNFGPAWIISMKYNIIIK